MYGVSSDALVRLASGSEGDCEAWLSCVSGDAWLSPFTSPESVRELQRCDKTVTTNWGNKKKSPLLKHVMSHRRLVHMIFKKDTDKPNLEF